MSNSILWLIITPISLFCLYAAWNDYEWLYRGRGQLWVRIFGREGARIALMIAYTLIAAVGIAVVLSGGS